jgi:hypothetical protein
MNRNIFSATLVLLIAVGSFAQTNAPTQPAAPVADKKTNSTNAPAKGEMTLEEELSLEPPINNTKINNGKAGTTENKSAENISSKTEFYGRDNEHALKGYSVGAIAYNQNFNANVALTVDGRDKTFGAKSPDIQFVGAIGRYTVFPYKMIGTDLAMTVATSVNHGTLNYSPMIATKLEINLGYAWQTLTRSSFYVFGGIGYETVKGKDIEKLIGAGGGIANLGLGLNFTKTISLEGVFTFARHPVSSVYLESVKTAVLNEGATSVTTNDSRSVINSYALQGRLIYVF